MTERTNQTGADEDHSLDSFARRFDQGHVPENWEDYNIWNSIYYAAMRSTECAAYEGHIKHKGKIWTVPLKILTGGALMLAGREAALGELEANHVVDAIADGILYGIPSVALLGNALYNIFTSKKTEMEKSIDRNQRDYLSHLPL